MNPSWLWIYICLIMGRRPIPYKWCPFRMRPKKRIRISWTCQDRIWRNSPEQLPIANWIPPRWSWMIICSNDWITSTPTSVSKKWVERPCPWGNAFVFALWWTYVRRPLTWPNWYSRRRDFESFNVVSPPISLLYKWRSVRPDLFPDVSVCVGGGGSPKTCLPNHA